jgi:uncharacterized protein (TIGR03086 family)
VDDQELLLRTRQALDTDNSLIRGTTADQWPLPTPCAHWNVGQLIEHMIAGVGSSGRYITEEPAPEQQPPATAMDAHLRFETAAGATMRAFARSGALERTYHPPWGESQGRTMANFLLIEFVVHGWDLARATRQRPAFDDQTVALAYCLARESLAGAPREPSFFGPEVIIDGEMSQLDALVALLGRDPR